MSYHDKTCPVVSQNLTVTGGTDSTLTVADTSGFFTNEKCMLTGNGLSVELIIAEVESSTVLRMAQYQYAPLGTVPSRINSGLDLSAYTVAGGAALTSIKGQPKPVLDAGSTPYYEHQPDPVSAKRVMLVDQQGNYANIANISVTINASDTVSVSVLNASLTVSPVLTASNFQYAKIANATLTAANVNITNTIQIMSLSRNTKVIQCFNSLNAGASLTLNGVETYNLEVGDSFSVDAGSDGLYWAQSTTIGIFYNAGVTATTGSLRLVCQG